MSNYLLKGTTLLRRAKKYTRPANTLNEIIKIIKNSLSIFEILVDNMISRSTKNTQIIDINNEKLNRIGAILTFNKSNIVAPI